MDFEKLFPKAEELKDKADEEYKKLVLQKDLESALNLVLWGVSNNLNWVNIPELCNDAIDFLKSKNYEIIKNDNYYSIMW